MCLAIVNGTNFTLWSSTHRLCTNCEGHETKTNGLDAVSRPTSPVRAPLWAHSTPSLTWCILAPQEKLQAFRSAPCSCSFRSALFSFSSLFKHPRLLISPIHYTLLQWHSFWVPLYRAPHAAPHAPLKNRTWMS